MTTRHKATTLTTLWAGIGISIYFSRSSVVAIVVLAVILVGVTIHILVLPTAPRSCGADATIDEQFSRPQEEEV